MSNKLIENEIWTFLQSTPNNKYLGINQIQTLSLNRNYRQILKTQVNVEIYHAHGLDSSLQRYILDWFTESINYDQTPSSLIACVCVCACVCAWACVQIYKLILKSVRRYKGLKMVQAILKTNKFRGLTLLNIRFST